MLQYDLYDILPTKLIIKDKEFKEASARGDPYRGQVLPGGARARVQVSQALHSALREAVNHHKRLKIILASNDSSKEKEKTEFLII